MTINNSNDDPINQLIDKAKPHLSTITFGGVVGYCSGAAAKQIGKAVAVMAGLIFIVVQSAVYTGYVAVDWEKVKDDALAKVGTVSEENERRVNIKIVSFFLFLFVVSIFRQIYNLLLFLLFYKYLLL